MKICYRRDLWRLLANKQGSAAEIGVAEGYFSADMLSWPINLPTLYMVDRWRCVPDQKGDASNSQEWHDKNFAAACARVAPFGERAVILRGDSVQMAKRVPDHSLLLCYIDGDHSFNGVMDDYDAWLPKVKRGGYMAFHDYQNRNYGVQQAVDMICESQGYMLHMLPEDKPEDAGAYFQV